MLLMIIVFFLFLLAGAPIVFAFAFSSITYVIQNPSIGAVIPPLFYSSLDSFPLLAIPFFLFGGELMAYGGISTRLVYFSQAIVGKMKGYLGSITVITCAFFAAISGSGIATVAAVGKVMIPEMIKGGYPKGYAAVLTGTAAILGVIIPPSIPMILFSFMGNASIAGLFLGGIVPGVILMVVFLLLNRLYVNKFQLTESDSLVPATSEISRMKNVFDSGRKAFFALMLPIIILGGIYSGLFTATEAAVVAVIYAIIIGFFFYKELTWPSFNDATRNTVLSTAFIFITFVFASIFARILTVEQIPLQLAEWMTNVFPEEWMILLTILIFLLILGMFMDTPTAVIVGTPILVPITASIGLDPVHFGVTLVVTLAIGQVTPPFAANLFLAGQISGASFNQQLVYVFPFIVAAIAVVFVLAFVPSIILWLPHLFL